MASMNLLKLIARVNNSERTDQGDKTLEGQLLQMHEEVSEVGKVLRTADGPLSMDFFNHTVLDDEGHLQGFGIEMIDVLFRWCRVAELTGLNVEALIELKLSEKEARAVRG